MDKLAVLIPCYNEEQTIGKVVTEAMAVLPEAIIYVYDNNSSDKTVEFAKAAGATVRFERKQGKGNVIRRMFREVDAQCYIMIDGDDTYPLEYARELADKVLLENADMVIGDRLSSTYFKENKRPFHNIGNSVVRLAINKLFHTNIKDIMTGYRAFSYQFIKTFPVISKGFEIETEMTIHAVYNNMQIENVIVDYRDRPEGSVSKLNTYVDGMKVLGVISKLFRVYKPLKFFGGLAICLLLGAAILFIPILLLFFEIGTVPNFPTLIVSGFMAIGGMQAFFAGLVLANIGEKDRRDFEYKLGQVSRHEM